jgi:ABC-type lipoprotein release transport system permease subunit
LIFLGAALSMLSMLSMLIMVEKSEINNFSSLGNKMFAGCYEPTYV